jgi:ferredoxin
LDVPPGLSWNFMHEQVQEGSIIGTCVCKILEGEVEYQEEPTAVIAEGSLLICISKPKTVRVLLEL